MKKAILFSLTSAILTSLLMLPASALTIEDLQAQVRDLLARIAALSAQKNQIVPQQDGERTVPATPVVMTNLGYPHRVCTLLTRSLSQGMSGDDVRGVQEFLQSGGFLSVPPTGYFGPLTSQAVAKWQSREGLSQVGVFGPLSRERLKHWCGGGSAWSNVERFTTSPTRGSAPLSVVFNTWLSGFRPNTTYYTIDFGDGTSERAADCPAPADACIAPGQNTHTYSSDGTYTAKLNRITDPCGGNLACKAAIHSAPVATLQIVVGQVACTQEYAPVCGSKQIVCITTPCNPIQQTYSNKCTATADGAAVLYDGQCRSTSANPADDPRCKVWSDGCNTCSRQYVGGPGMCTLMACAFGSDLKPYCKGYFEATSNKSPTISGFSGPTTLAVSASGTWSVQASDPEGGQLTYSITWGDEATIYPYAAAMSVDRTFIQNTSFTHAYANAGTYTVTIVVRDQSGAEAQTSATVTVGGGVVACTMEYAPVCGKPSGCLYSSNVAGSEWVTQGCSTGITYSNLCLLNAAGAVYSHEGICTATPGVSCTADAYQCSDGTWVGRTGTQCQFVCPTIASGVRGADAETHACTYAGASYEHDALNTTGPGGAWLPQRCCNGVWRSSLGNLIGAPVCSSPLWPQN